MELLPWNQEWNDKDYEWPVTSIPDPDLLATIAQAAGGYVAEEAHADRGITMRFPNPAIPNTSIHKKQTRAECRRRAKVASAPQLAGTCVVCDAVHLWPRYAAAVA